MKESSAKKNGACAGSPIVSGVCDWPGSVAGRSPKREPPHAGNSALGTPAPQRAAARAWHATLHSPPSFAIRTALAQPAYHFVLVDGTEIGRVHFASYPPRLAPERSITRELSWHWTEVSACELKPEGCSSMFFQRIRASRPNKRPPPVWQIGDLRGRVSERPQRHSCLFRNLTSARTITLTMAAAVLATFAQARASEVSLYSYQEPQSIEPLLRAFHAATGIAVKTTYAPQGLVERIVGEGQKGLADVLLTNDFALLLDAHRRGLTQAFKSRVVETNVPANYRDPNGHWVGLTQHARLFVVSTRRVKTNVLTYEELALPEWKGKLCIRSGRHAYNVGWVASMLGHYDAQRTEAWLRAVRDNLAREPSGGDPDQIRAVIEGVCDLAVVNSYYVGSFVSTDQNLREHKQDVVRIVLPNAATHGTHVSISGAALMKYSQKRENSIKLIEFLTSAQGQRIYSAINDSYPVNPAVVAPSLTTNWPSLKPDSLPLHKIAEMRTEALTLIESVGFDRGDVSSAGAKIRTRLKFALDWSFEGPSAPFFVAIDRGYYDKEGIEVTIDRGKGSIESIERVASGSHEIGFADTNSLIRHIGNAEGSSAKAVLIGYNAPPFAIVSLKKSRIETPRDLEGRVLGAPAADGAYAQWPIFVLANNVDASKVRIKDVSFVDREAMLTQGKVDAITGFWFSSLLNLTAQGVAIDDISVMLMSDHGLDLYGNAVIASPSIMKSNPSVVAAFVRATIRGFHDTIASPETAIKSVIKRNAAANEQIEIDRLKMAIARNYITREVLLNGLGDVDEARLERAIRQIAAVSRLTSTPRPLDIFAKEFLPAKELRTLGR